MKNPYDIVKRARVTEKAGGLKEKHNQYVFEVNLKATKQDIRHAVEKIFNKKVDSVNTLRVTGKKKRERTAAFGKKPNWKKAIVTLKAGETLELI
jgi:large subunit ribosomal protein L23